MKFPDEAQDLGVQLRSRRKDLRLTQQELADLAGCSVRFLRELESGKSSVRLDKLLSVAEALGLAATLTLRKP